MKRFRKYTLLMLLCPLLGLTGCQKEGLATYEGAEMVNFDYNKMSNTSEVKFKGDTVRLAYGFVNDEYQIINLELILTGYPKNADRKVLVSVNSEDGAKAGVHYELSESIVIPANQVMVTVPLKVLRPADLMDAPKSFLVKIGNSEELSAGIRTTLFVAVSDDIPTEWVGDAGWFQPPYIKDYFGKCSKTKYLFVYQQLGVWDFSGYSIWNMMADAAKFAPAKRVLKQKLAEYEAENGPLMDPKEGQVTFPD